jgi:hypothetical protein
VIRTRDCGICGKDVGPILCIRDGRSVCSSCLFKDKVCPSCERVYHHSVRARACPVCYTRLTVRD